MVTGLVYNTPGSAPCGMHGAHAGMRYAHAWIIATCTKKHEAKAEELEKASKKSKLQTSVNKTQRALKVDLFGWITRARMSTVTSATGTTLSVVTPSTAGITPPTPGGGRTVLATPLQAMINNAIAASMTAMSSSIERMVQEAVSKATTPGPGATPSTTSGAGGGLPIPRDTGLTSTSGGTHPCLPCVGGLPGSAALSSIPLFTTVNTGSISSLWRHHLSLWLHSLVRRHLRQMPFWSEPPLRRSLQRSLKESGISSSLVWKSSSPPGWVRNHPLWKPYRIPSRIRRQRGSSASSSGCAALTPSLQ